MSRVIRNIISNAFVKNEINALIFNIVDESDIIGFDNIKIFSFEDKVKSDKIIKIPNNILDTNLALKIDCFINLRPFRNNINNIISLSDRSGIKLYNYLIDIDEIKSEELIDKARKLEQFDVIYIDQSVDLKKIYLPNKKITNKNKFIKCII